MKVHVTEIDEKQPAWHRSKIIVHKENGFYLSEFANQEQLDKWCKSVGVLLGESTEEYRHGNFVKTYNVNQQFDEKYFSNKKDLPSNVVPHKGVVMGSIVTCYVLIEGNITTIYRPEPSMKEVFNPLTAEEHVKFVRENGHINIEEELIVY